MLVCSPLQRYESQHTLQAHRVTSCPPAAGGCGPWSRHAARRLATLLRTARHRCRAHAPCSAAPHAACRSGLARNAAATKTTAAVRPVLALQPRAASAWLRAGPLFELTPALKGAAKVRAVLASSRCAASVRCGRRIIVDPSFASPGEVHPKVRCQRSSRRTGQRGLTAGLPPPHAGLPAALTPPWGSATSRRCALGSLLWPHPPRWGTRCAAGYASCTDYLNVSGQAEGSIVTPQNLSRARLAMLGGCATLDRTCGAPAEAFTAWPKTCRGRKRQSQRAALRRLSAARIHC